MLGNIDVGGDALISILGNGFLVDYEHIVKGSDPVVLTDILGYYKSVLQVKDQFGNKTQTQNPPRIRLTGIPWDEKSLVGDVITAKNANYPAASVGRKWKVTSADTSPLGITTCNLDMISR